MDISEGVAAEIAEIQQRFRSAAACGEGLSLSRREVAILASLDEVETVAEQMELPAIALDIHPHYHPALALLPKTCPIEVCDDGLWYSITRTALVAKFLAWGDAEWDFAPNKITVTRKTGTFIIPLQPSLSHDDNQSNTPIGLPQAT